MKNLKIFALLLCFLSGCHTICEDGPALFCLYEFSNESGHTVSVVPPAAVYSTPALDSLVLRSGERYVWKDDNTWGRFRPPYSQSNIYYDGRYKLNANELRGRKLDNYRSFQSSQRYESSVDDTLTCYTYTFTPEDYDYAVERGNDLETAETQTPPQAAAEEW